MFQQLIIHLNLANKQTIAETMKHNHGVAGKYGIRVGRSVLHVPLILLLHVSVNFSCTKRDQE